MALQLTSILTLCPGNLQLLLQAGDLLAGIWAGCAVLPECSCLNLHEQNMLLH